MTFSLGGGFNLVYCKPFTGIEASSFYEDERPNDYSYYNNTLIPDPSPNTVICPVRPTTIGNQDLSAKDSNDDRSFPGFPISIDVKPFRVRDIDLNNPTHWSATYLENDDGYSRMNLVVDMTDVYGNLIAETTICDYYQHERLVFWAETTNEFSVTQDHRATEL
jgi:hypothetical protein